LSRSNNDSVPGTPATPLGWTITISDLEWDVPSTLTGVSVTDNTAGVDPFVVTWTPDTISIEFIGREGDNTNLDAAWITDDHTGYLSADITLQTTPLPSAIPTLSEWGMITFFVLLIGSALWIIRRRTSQKLA
jgi:hypothetical protein